MKLITGIATGFTTGFTVTLIVWAVATAPDEPRVVDFTATPPPTATHTADPQALAAEYAAGHDLTKCVDPARGFDAGSDVVLTIATDELGVPTTTEVTPVTLDEALDSAGIRVNLLACKAGE